jgi:Ca2+:H+ antiporter
VTDFILLVYLCYLVFQLFSHKNIYEARHTDVPQSVKYNSDVGEKFQKVLRHRKSNATDHPPSSLPRQSTEIQDTENPPRDPGRVEAAPVEEDETPQMDVRTTIVLLIVVTVVCRSFTLLSIPGLNMQNSSSLSPPNFWSILLTVSRNPATSARGS